MALKLSVVTPQGTMVDRDVDSAVAPGSEGEFGVLPEHELFLAPLSEGELCYEADGRTSRVSISGGFAEVTGDRLTVLTRRAEVSD